MCAYLGLKGLGLTSRVQGARLVRGNYRMGLRFGVKTGPFIHRQDPVRAPGKQAICCPEWPTFNAPSRLK